MSAETEVSEARKTSKVKSLWKRIWRKIGEVLVVMATLILIYYLLAVWGVIALILAGFAKAGLILKREATKRALGDRS